jgi:hypothetical protein
MRIIATIILAFILLAAKCQSPDQIGYSEELHNQIVDSVIDHYEGLILIQIQNCNEQLFNSQVIIDSLEIEIAENSDYSQPIDTTELFIYDDSLSIDIRKRGYDITLTIVRDTNRYHLWYLPTEGRIEARAAYGNIQPETWDIKNKSLHYKP